jgi:WD40 repeat protein
MQVGALAAWGSKAVSASKDEAVSVWDLETGALEATLRGHRGSILALLVHADRLYSASADGTVREWAAGTWEELRVLVACDGAGRYWPCCLAVSGGAAFERLLGGAGSAAPRAGAGRRVQPSLRGAVL